MSRPYNSNERENRTMQKNITLIYGDCSSPEIVTQAVRVLDKIAARHGHTFTYTRAYMGGEAIDRFGDCCACARAWASTPTTARPRSGRSWRTPPR